MDNLLTKKDVMNDFERFIKNSLYKNIVVKDDFFRLDSEGNYYWHRASELFKVYKQPLINIGLYDEQ